MGFFPLQNGDRSLKWLGFFQVSTQNVTTHLSVLYGYAKENSGPLKQVLDTIEGTVKLIVGPVYPKVQGNPFDIMLLADRKVCPCSIIKWYIFYYYIRINGFFAKEWGLDSQMARIFPGCHSKCNYLPLCSLRLRERELWASKIGAGYHRGNCEAYCWARLFEGPGKSF